MQLSGVPFQGQLKPAPSPSDPRVVGSHGEDISPRPVHSQADPGAVIYNQVVMHSLLRLFRCQNL